MQLPIDHILPSLKDALRARTSAVLQAPPGAGKTTRIPLALLNEPWLAEKKVIMLEPRRLAARAAARRMASTLGEEVGRTVGYRMRMESRVSRGTRIEVVTEGVLTRFLQSDPALEGTGIVIFDEFHERSLQADLGLALALQAQSLLRDDLRLLVMSATLDGQAIAALLGDAPIITSEGKSYPVETRYLGRHAGERIERAVASAVRSAATKEEGDILVFLPGAGEIRRTAALLEEMSLPAGTNVAQLYGSLPQGEQDRVIEPSPPGRRKIVLSTSIAETSLTIEGITIVIDSGLLRVPRFSPRSGMTRLETVRVTKASADQRRGRAGRLAPGICYRLWSEGEQEHLLAHGTPEILEADLTPLALELAAWGVTDPSELAWLDAPSPAAYAQARDLLTWLGALDESGAITPHGRRMAELPLHPRLAHMVLKGGELGHGSIACDLAALLSERDIFRGESGALDADIRLRLETIIEIERGERTGDLRSRGVYIDRGAASRIVAEAKSWKKRFGFSGANGDIEACGLLLAFAYPDRIAGRRGEDSRRYLLRNGNGAYFSTSQLLAGSPWLVAAELDGARRESRIFLAAPIDQEDIERHFVDEIDEEEMVAWESEAGAVRARRRTRLGALVLRDVALRDPDPELVMRGLLDGITQEGLSILPWSSGAERVRERMSFMYHLDPSWPDVSDETLLATLPEWLGPYLHGMRRRDDLARLDLASIVLGMLPWEKRSALDEMAPSHLVVPSGSRIPIDYGNPEAPALAVRLQEMFGLSETPSVARGAVPLTIHLLSPANRPVQVTRDLASFWRTTYFEVKKDLKGRYPKHYWPDDPTQAVPTSRVRPRG